MSRRITHRFVVIVSLLTNYQQDLMRRVFESHMAAAWLLVSPSSPNHGERILRRLISPEDLDLALVDDDDGDAATEGSVEPKDAVLQGLAALEVSIKAAPSSNLVHRVAWSMYILYIYTHATHDIHKRTPPAEQLWAEIIVEVFVAAS